MSVLPGHLTDARIRIRLSDSGAAGEIDLGWAASPGNSRGQGWEQSDRTCPSVWSAMCSKPHEPERKTWPALHSSSGPWVPSGDNQGLAPRCRWSNSIRKAGLGRLGTGSCSSNSPSLVRRRLAPSDIAAGITSNFEFIRFGRARAQGSKQTIQRALTYDLLQQLPAGRREGQWSAFGHGHDSAMLHGKQYENQAGLHGTTILPWKTHMYIHKTWICAATLHAVKTTIPYDCTTKAREWQTSTPCGEPR